MPFTTALTQEQKDIQMSVTNCTYSNSKPMKPTGGGLTTDAGAQTKTSRWKAFRKRLNAGMMSRLVNLTIYL